jgi:hypothetical protein
MDDPFAMAAEDLAQSDLATKVSYQFAGGGPSLPDVPLIFTEVEEEAEGPGGGRIMAIRTEAIVTAAVLAPGRPQKGDLIGLGATGGWRVASVRQDARGVRFILGLGRQ